MTVTLGSRRRARHRGGATGGFERFSISLPAQVAAFLHSQAKDRRQAKSAVIADALVRLQREERRERTIQALLANAALDRKLAEEAITTAVPPVEPAPPTTGVTDKPVRAG